MAAVSAFHPAIFKGAHTRSAADQRLGTCTLEKALTFFKDYSPECSTEIKSLQAQIQSGKTDTDLGVFYSVICGGGCRQPIQNFRDSCDVDGELTGPILSACREHDRTGKLCITELAKNDGRQVVHECYRAVAKHQCSQNCRSSLEKLKGDLDCCVESLFNTSTYGYDVLGVADYHLWSLCDVATLDHCRAESSRFRSHSVSTATASALVTLLMLCIAILSRL